MTGRTLYNLPNATTVESGDKFLIQQGVSSKQVDKDVLLTAENTSWEAGKSVGYALDDWQGFTDELYAQSGTVDNGFPDVVGNSQRVNALNKLFYRYGTVATLAAGKHSTGSIVTLTDRYNGIFKVEDAGWPQIINGYDVLDAGDGKVGVYQKDPSFINAGHLGASPDLADNLPVFNHANAIALSIDAIFIPAGDFKISDEFEITKTIKLFGAAIYLSRIKNEGTGNGIRFSTAEGQSCYDLSVLGHVGSGNGVCIDSNHFYGERFAAEENGGEGVFVVPNHWVIKLRNVVTFNNRGNGIHAVATGFVDGQINDLGVHGCTIWLNDKSGVLSNALSMDVSGQNLIEGNGRYGVEFTSKDHVAIGGMSVHHNYMEQNGMGHVGYSLGNHNISNTQVYGNIMILENPTSALPAHIEANLIDGYTGGLVDNVTIGENVYISSAGVRHVNFNNLTARNCGGEVRTVDIPDIDWSYYYINLGEIKMVVSPKDKVISGANNSTGVFQYTSVENYIYCDNLAAGSVGIPKAQRFDSGLVSAEIPTKVSFNLSYVGSSCTVTITLIYVNSRNGSSVGKTSQVLGPFSGAAYVETGWFAAGAVPETLRLKPEERLIIEIEVLNQDASATSMRVGNPVLRYL